MIKVLISEGKNGENMVTSEHSDYEEALLFMCQDVMGQLAAEMLFMDQTPTNCIVCAQMEELYQNNCFEAVMDLTKKFHWQMNSKQSWEIRVIH